MAGHRGDEEAALMGGPLALRRIGLLSLAAGLVALGFALVLPDAGNALKAVLVGGIRALLSHGDAQHQAELLGGNEVIARWQADSARWRSFVSADQALRGEQGWRLNDLSIPKPPSARPVEVTVGSSALQVGGDFHSFRSSGFPTVQYAVLRRSQPPMVELGLRHTGMPGRSSSREYALRFPGGAGAEALAAQVVAHFSTFEQRRLVPAVAT